MLGSRSYGENKTDLRQTDVSPFSDGYLCSWLHFPRFNRLGDCWPTLAIYTGIEVPLKANRPPHPNCCICITSSLRACRLFQEIKRQLSRLVSRAKNFGINLQPKNRVHNKMFLRRSRIATHQLVRITDVLFCTVMRLISIIFAETQKPFCMTWMLNPIVAVIFCVQYVESTRVTVS